MSFSLKRNTAVIIFLAFMFRLVFVNISAFACPEPTLTKYLNPVHSTIGVLKKRLRDTEEVTRSTFEKYSVIEEYEENSDSEENLVKANTPVILCFVYSFFKVRINQHGSNNSFDSIKSNLFARKYLAFSILRI